MSGAEMPTGTGDSVRTSRVEGEQQVTNLSVLSAGQRFATSDQSEQIAPFESPGNGSSGDAHERPLASDASSGGSSELALLGRRSETRALDELLEGVRAGHSRVLVLRGESGAGKTALLEYLAASASGCRVARVAGVESELGLAHAGLHQLCAPVLELRERLPAPQRDALATAFGLSAEAAPDRFVVGLGVLGLLSEVVEERPLICIVDDAQWLDNASALALAFVARRLPDGPIGVIFAVREPNEMLELAGLPELAVGGLSEDDASVLLESALPGRFDERVLDRFVCESGGNPLTLLDLTRGSGPGRLAGGFAFPDATPFANRGDRRLARRLASLSVETCRLLLVAASEPLGDVSLLWRAAGRLGLGADAAAPALAAGLISIGSKVLFRDPLTRSGVYCGASPADRRMAHWVLAEATDAELDPDRRAWHRAHSVDAPDEDVAADLERWAGVAEARGGFAATAAFLERATELTPEPVRRGRRALGGAQAHLQAGAFEPAVSLLGIAETGPSDALRRAQTDRTRAQIALARGRVREATPLLLGAAQTLEPLDVGLSRATYLDALSAALFAGHLTSPSVVEVAQAAREAPPASQADGGDMLLDALALRLTDGYAAALALSRQAVGALRDDGYTVQEGLRWLWLTSQVAADLWDDERWDAFSSEHVKIAREAGSLSALSLALNSRVYVDLFAGEFAKAATVVREARIVSATTGSDLAPYGAVALAAWKGREDEASSLIEATMSDLIARGEGVGVTLTRWATAFLFNGLGRYEDALAAAREAAGYEELSARNWGAVELIEAAARTGATEVATEALDRLSEATRASGTDWALGVEARSRALLSEGEPAECLYREAIERLDRTRIRVELARARLVFGEWLRREGRRLDAREQLRVAYETFATIGTEAFAERARRELLATGHRARKRVDETRGDLTPQEANIARLARDGLSNPEIGAQLYLSARTIEWHLRKVFSKLGISSRRQLLVALPVITPPIASDLA